MMRAKEIILEAGKLSIPGIVETVKRDCSPFLSAVGNRVSAFPLYRGSEKRLPVFSKHQCPLRRRPRDTSPTIHAASNVWFLEKFGIAFRSNSVFACGDENTTIEYGPTYMLFPIGNYSFCWSPAGGDFTYDLMDQIDDSLKKDLLQQFVNNLLDRSNYRMNDNMKKAISSGSEIMIHCPAGFYLLKCQDNYGNNIVDAFTRIFNSVVKKP